jgi:hypothetical protein
MKSDLESNASNVLAQFWGADGGISAKWDISYIFYILETHFSFHLPSIPSKLTCDGRKDSEVNPKMGGFLLPRCRNEPEIDIKGFNFTVIIRKFLPKKNKVDFSETCF